MQLHPQDLVIKTFSQTPISSDARDNGGAVYDGHRHVSQFRRPHGHTYHPSTTDTSTPPTATMIGLFLTPYAVPIPPPQIIAELWERRANKKRSRPAKDDESSPLLNAFRNARRMSRGYRRV
ncbi:hypothetical protein HJFPF1_06268 [Paramyrothecium foliicola]|nr:hypothetical protein HJFPF1_06268 [Paramyrothecium foliicola]